MSMRGLTVFVADLRACRSHDEEQRRISKELANIRQKFRDPKLPGLKRKKYVCKLIYIYILGYPLDIALGDAVRLVSSTVYSEKQVGYLATSIIVPEDSPLMDSVVTALSNDLDDTREQVACLALHTIANICSRNMVDTLCPQVIHVLLRSQSLFIQRKAALTLLRMYRRFPQQVPLGNYASELCVLLETRNFSVALCVLSLLHVAAVRHTDLFLPAAFSAIELLHRILSGNVPPTYVYYSVPAPWLQIKILRFLQLFDYSASTELVDRTQTALHMIISGYVETVSASQHRNADVAVFVEATNLAIHIDPSSALVAESSLVLSRFLKVKETNMRYTGLEMMVKLAQNSESVEAVRSHIDIVLNLLTDRDVSVCRRTLDVLFVACNIDNAKMIVDELLRYLGSSDYQVREELVIRIAIIAERFATDYNWYLDVILQLITQAGDAGAHDVWYRIVQIVTMYPDLQEYAAKTLLLALKASTCHDSTVKIGGYILGEYGQIIANQPESSPSEQFNVINVKFMVSNVDTRALLLTTYLKMANKYPTLKEDIRDIFKEYRLALDAELQQRACEYYELCSEENAHLLNAVCQAIPPFVPKENNLVNLLQRGKGQVETEHDNESLALKSHKLLLPTSKVSGAILAPVGKKITDEDDRKKTISNGNGGIGITRVKHNRPTDISPIETEHRPPSPVRSDSLPSPIRGLFSLNLSYSASNPQPTVDLKQQYNMLLIVPNGVLYEDMYLQIGMKSEYSAEKGVLQLFLGNKTPTAFENVHCELVLPSGDQYPFGEENGATNGVALELLSRAPTTIPGGSQHVQAYSAVCYKVFDLGLRLRIRYTVGQHVDVQGNVVSPHSVGPILIDFPLVATKFIAAVEQQSQQFADRWRQIGGPPREVEFVQAATNRTQLTAERIRTCLLGSGFWAVADVPGLSMNASGEVLFGSGIFLSRALGKVGCLIRVEVNHDMAMYRCTIRTTNDQVSRTVAADVQRSLMGNV